MDRQFKAKMQAARQKKKLRHQIKAQEVILAGLSSHDYPDERKYEEAVSRVKNKLRRLSDELAGIKNERRTQTMPEGTIKTIMSDRGFGFIAPSEEKDDIFFHISALEDVQLEELSIGDPVTYEAEVSEKGPRATVVRKVEEE